MRAIAASTSSAGVTSPRATSSAWAVASSHAQPSDIGRAFSTGTGAGAFASVVAPDRLRPWTTPPSARAARWRPRSNPSSGRCSSRRSVTPRTPQLGFAPSPGQAGLVALPDGPAYFTSRGSLLGQVRPGVVAAAFGVFKPEVVSAGVTLGLVAHRRPDDLRGAPRRARSASSSGCSASRRRSVGARRRSCSSAGRRRSGSRGGRCSPVCARGGTTRPTRGRASSISATCSASAAATRTSARGRAPRSTASRSACSTTFTWVSRCAATCAPAAGTKTSWTRARSGCASSGWLDGDAFTDEGQAAREDIERATDRQMTPALDALGDDFDELIGAPQAVGCGDARGRRLRRRAGRSLARSRRLTAMASRAGPADRPRCRSSCRGHPNVTATHDKTLELTRDAEISRRATCVVGVASEHDDRALLALRGTVEVALECDGVRDEFTATISPFFLGDSLARVPPRTRACAAARSRSTRRRPRRRSTASSSRGSRRRTRELRVTITAVGGEPAAGRAVRRVAPDRQRRRHRPASGRGAGARRPRARRGHAPAARARRSGSASTRARATSYHDHNEAQRVEGVLERLRRGARVALVSDAGTPLCSDPGYVVVSRAVAEGIPVCPVPGPSAALAVLAASGSPGRPVRVRRVPAPPFVAAAAGACAS